MNIFKKIALINKVRKSIKQAKKMIDDNNGLAAQVRSRIEYLINDVEELIRLLPQFKSVYEDVEKIVKEVF